VRICSIGEVDLSNSHRIPYYRTPSSNTQRIVDESESELEDDRQRYAGLEATKPGEKPRVVVLGTGWAA
ncbi:hypothetical protein RYX36_008798, partial [Vicia faba]